jgi:hypothetical protein
MEIYRVETTIAEDGSLAIRGLPFAAGEKVEVTIRNQAATPIAATKYPLRGQPLEYRDPFESAVNGDWDALK